MARPTTTTLLPSPATPSFIIGQDQKTYKHQYANIYFVRLTELRGAVEKRAKAKWGKLHEKPRLVQRVLEVTKGNLCYVVGTVYMDMPLKPNVMEDITRDRSIQAPPPLPKIHSANDTITLEDESGRIHLVGDKLASARLVTGVILGVLGMETPNGDFEVVDFIEAGLAPQTSTGVEHDDDESMEIDGTQDPWIAIASGLDVGASHASEARIQMLAEYLSGEGCDDESKYGVPPSQITRLILAGDSLSSAAIAARAESVASATDRKSKKQAQDAIHFDPHPIHELSAHLTDIGNTIPLHIIPGELDPSGVILPQQPLPRAMFTGVSRQPGFFCEPNPTYIRVAPGSVKQNSPKPDANPDDVLSSSILAKSRTILVNSGQPLNDMFKYLPNRGNSRLSILESTLRWRHMSPTAPDTLWCHPYLHEDPFILHETPDLYIVGGQRRFGTKLVVGESSEGQSQNSGVRCRIVMVPHFSRTGVLVLVNLRTLDVQCMNFGFDGMTGGGDMDVSLDDLKAPAPSQMSEQPMLTAPTPSGSPGPM